MAGDDWRLRIELGPGGAHGLLGRLGLVDTDADELARGLRGTRLAVTRDEDTVFVYADAGATLEQARPAIEAELAKLDLRPELVALEHWLDDEDRWDDEPPGATVLEETAAHGYAPWEVRIPCRSHREARELALRLEADGYGVVRRWSYVIAGTETREEAERLAASLHGEAEPGGELVWETSRGNPFAIFGGLGGAGTPL
ncbi:MAG TPA: hypothetical protein VFB42_02875 [Gaiellaceae bacterium]|nr:hypothetical protein [Gaiellaceae bacterium]